MKYTTIISGLAIATAVAACSKTEPVNTITPASTPEAISLKVTNWGPQAAAVGTIPGKQPDGSMGVWIQVAETKGFGEAQVLFGGQPAKSTVVAENLITAAIAPEQIAEPGNKEITVKQVATNKLFPVGVFSITAR